MAGSKRENKEESDIYRLSLGKVIAPWGVPFSGGSVWTILPASVTIVWPLMGSYDEQKVKLGSEVIMGILFYPTIFIQNMFYMQKIKLK